MKKIRGYKRRLRQIENWRLNNLQLNLDYLKKNQRDYVKFRIYPWNPVAMSINHIPFPRGEVKKRIIESFMDIYNSWKKQLEKIGEPYYLKIWLFEPDFWNTQVVCAIGDALHFYDQTFYKPDTAKNLRIENYGKIAGRLIDYTWDFHFSEYELFENEYIDKEQYKSEEEFLSSKRWFDNELKKPHRVVEIKYEGKSDRIYWIKTGTVWIGEKTT
jgi:hypothetical protein